MIKYSQGEIIVDLTGLKYFDDGDTLDVSEIMEDYFKTNMDKNGHFISEKVMSKRLIFIINNIDNETLRFEINYITDDRSALLSFITVYNEDDEQLKTYQIQLDEDKTLQYIKFEKIFS